MSAYQRRKGHRFERYCARRIAEVMPGEDVKRGLQSRGGTSEIPDVDCPIFWPECKVGKRPNLRAALQQAMDGAPRGRIPIAITKRDREDPLVTMTLDDWLDLIGEWWRRGQR